MLSGKAEIFKLPCGFCMIMAARKSSWRQEPFGGLWTMQSPSVTESNTTILSGFAALALQTFGNRQACTQRPQTLRQGRCFVPLNLHAPAQHKTGPQQLSPTGETLSLSSSCSETRGFPTIRTGMVVSAKLPLLLAIWSLSNGCGKGCPWTSGTGLFLMTFIQVML